MSPRRILGLLLVLGAGLWAVPVAHAGPIFVKLDGVKGGSMESAHVGWFYAESYSFSVSAQGAPGDAPRPTLSPLKVVLATDTGLPGLLAAHGRNATIPEVTIHVTGTSSGPTGPNVYLTIKLTNARVLDLTLAGPSNAAPSTEASFGYDGIDFELTPPGATLGAKALKSGYTISSNAVR